MPGPRSRRTPKTAAPPDPAAAPADPADPATAPADPAPPPDASAPPGDAAEPGQAAAEHGEPPAESDPGPMNRAARRARRRGTSPDPRVGAGGRAAVRRDQVRGLPRRQGRRGNR